MRCPLVSSASRARVADRDDAARHRRARRACDARAGSRRLPTAGCAGSNAGLRHASPSARSHGTTRRRRLAAPVHQREKPRLDRLPIHLPSAASRTCYTRSLTQRTGGGGWSDLLSSLNPMQQHAVLHGDGPLLILAGAGSGKTRTLTHRVAHLIGDARRRAVAHPRRHLHQQGGGRDARAARAPARRRRAALGVDLPRRLRAHPAARDRGARLQLELRHLRRPRQRSGCSRTASTCCAYPEQTLNAASGRRADRRRQEPGPDAAGLRAQRRAARRPRAACTRATRTCCSAPTRSTSATCCSPRCACSRSTPTCSTATASASSTSWSTSTRTPTRCSTGSPTCSPRATATCAWSATTTSRSTAGAAPRSPTSSTSSATIPTRSSSAWSRTTAPPATSSPPPARWWRATRAARARRCGPRTRAATRSRSRR